MADGLNDEVVAIIESVLVARGAAGVALTPDSGMGNPHIVFFPEQATDELILRVGPKLETHPAFPNCAAASRQNCSKFCRSSPVAIIDFNAII